MSQNRIAVSASLPASLTGKIVELSLYVGVLKNIYILGVVILDNKRFPGTEHYLRKYSTWTPYGQPIFYNLGGFHALPPMYVWYYSLHRQPRCPVFRRLPWSQLRGIRSCISVFLRRSIHSGNDCGWSSRLQAEEEITVLPKCTYVRPSTGPRNVR